MFDSTCRFLIFAPLLTFIPSERICKICYIVSEPRNKEIVCFLSFCLFVCLFVCLLVCLFVVQKDSIFKKIGFAFIYQYRAISKQLFQMKSVYLTYILV